MTKSTTPAQAGTEKTRKTRAAKQLAPADIIMQIEKLPLADKLSIRGMITKSIEADRQRLEDQLKLIQGNTPELTPNEKERLSEIVKDKFPS